MNVLPEGLLIGPILVRWYGILVCLGVFVGLIAASRFAQSFQLRPDSVWRAAVWVVPGMILGGRAWYVLFPPQSAVLIGRDAGWMISHFFDLNQGAVAFWAGGMGYLGAIWGGAMALFWYARHHGQSWLNWFDLGALALPLGAMVAYWGVGLGSNQGEFHPVWFYESLLCGAVFGGLWVRQRRSLTHLHPGEISALFWVGYGGGRFFLEFLRTNVSLLFGVNVSQAACALLALSGWAWWRRLRSGSPSSAVHADK